MGTWSRCWADRRRGGVGARWRADKLSITILAFVRAALAGRGITYFKVWKDNYLTKCWLFFLKSSTKVILRNTMLHFGARRALCAWQVVGSCREHAHLILRTHFILWFKLISHALPPSSERGGRQPQAGWWLAGSGDDAGGGADPDRVQVANVKNIHRRRDVSWKTT